MPADPDRWVNEKIIRRTGGRPSHVPAPRPYVPHPDDAAPDPRPFATWTARCEAAECPALPRLCVVRMVVHRHLDWPDRVAASVHTQCLCGHHARTADLRGWIEVGVRPI